MRKTNFILLAVAAIAAISCAKEMVPENNQNNTSDKNLVPMSFTAGTEDATTKVLLQENGKSLHWEVTDQIKIFDGVSNDLAAFTTTGSGASVTFNGNITEGATGPFYALYPYQADATYGLDADAENRPTIYAEVPSVQNAVAGSVPSNAFIAAAKSDDANYFNFSSICGYIKFTLNQDNVESITFSGNNNESLTGKIKIYFKDDGTPNHTYVSGGMKPTVTLTGDLKNGETYYAAVRPCAFSQGLSVSILFKDGTRSYVTTTTAPSESVAANKVMNLASPATYNSDMPEDNFIAYIHGYDLDLPAGVTYEEAVIIDASAKDSSSKLQNNMKGDKDRVIFISAETGSEFSFSSVTGMDKNIAVIGRYNDIKPTLKSTKYIRTKNGSFLLKNVIVDASGLADKYLFQHSNSTSDLGEFIIDGCWFKNLGKTFWQCAEGHDYSVKKFTLKNNKIEIKANDISIFNFYRPLKSANLHIENNIFYGGLSSENAEVNYTGFKVINHTAYQDLTTGLVLDKVVLNYNTFVNLYFNKQGFVSANQINEAEVKSNLISVPNYISVVGTNFWGMLFAYGRKTITSSVDESGDTKTITTYDTYEQYAETTSTETTTVTAKEGTNPNYYPAPGKITVMYNTAYRTLEEGQTNRYPKASYLDLKLHNEVFCSKGTFYTNVSNPSAVNADIFSSKDFTNGVFTKVESCKDRGASIAE